MIYMKQDKYIDKICERNIRVELREKRLAILAKQKETHPEFWMRIKGLLPNLSEEKKLILADLIHQHFN